MKTTPKQAAKKKRSPLSKGFTEGINTLFDEIQLAFQWQRPSILLAIHNTSGGQVIAQQFLEKKLAGVKQKVKYIKPEGENPDVISTIASTPDHEKTVFFISGLENANQLSGGEVYRALNLHREHLVEQKICVVFWLTETEAINLPHLAPDLWAFRHRVVEFAPQRGSRSPAVPAGLLLWKEQLAWMDQTSYKKQIEYYEDLLSRLPTEESAMTTRLDTTLKLIHLYWQLNDLGQFSKHFDHMVVLLKLRDNLQYHGWALNAKGIQLFEEGDKQAARSCFDQALTIEPNNSTFIVNSAVVAHGVGKNRESILAIQRAIKIDPRNSRLWYILGHLYLSIGKPQNAVESMEKALEKEPGNLDVQNSLALCYSKNNQPEACAALLEKSGKNVTEQNILQAAFLNGLSGNMEDGITKLRHALASKEIYPYQIMRDPNLCALFDTSILLNISK